MRSLRILINVTRNEEGLDPGPRIRCGAWLREICAARSLGKRVFCDKIKIATKERKLHYFGKFMEFMTQYDNETVTLSNSRMTQADCERLGLRAFSHQTSTMSLIIQMEFSCIENNTVSGIRLIGQKYQAN